jgi:hypothetical protein
MKIRPAIAGFSILLGTFLALPAFAQTPQTENALQQMMIRHPELQNNPGLLNNPGYLQQHKNIKAFMEHHPGAERQVRNQYGAYDNGRVWRNQGWWHSNNPEWMYAHHPEWAESHPNWRGDGDWDDHHNWHSRDRLYSHNREWAEHHHPEWRGNWKHHGHHHGHDDD